MKKATQFVHSGYTRRHPLLTWLFSLLGVSYWSISNQNERGTYWDAARQQNRTLHGPTWQKGNLRLAWGGEHSRSRAFGVEWSVPTHLKGLYLHWTDEGRISLGLSLGLGIWLSLDGLPCPRPYLDYGETRYKSYNRDLSISWHNGGLWWNLWRDDSGWSHKVPKWRHGNFNLVDALRGRSKYSKQELRTERALIPLPEGGTEATFTFSESTWQYPRWPVARRMIGCEITPDRPAVVPGKGENSWDMDDDAIESMSCPAATVEAAIAAYLESVLRDRRRYGGSVGWQPDRVA